VGNEGHDRENERESGYLRLTANGEQSAFSDENHFVDNQINKRNTYRYGTRSPVGCFPSFAVYFSLEDSELKLSHDISYMFASLETFIF